MVRMVNGKKRGTKQWFGAKTSGSVIMSHCVLD